MYKIKKKCNTDSLGHEAIILIKSAHFNLVIEYICRNLCIKRMNFVNPFVVSIYFSSCNLVEIIVTSNNVITILDLF